MNQVKGLEKMPLGAHQEHTEKQQTRKFTIHKTQSTQKDLILAEE
jgi:hypothetical protein